MKNGLLQKPLPWVPLKVAAAWAEDRPPRIPRGRPMAMAPAAPPDRNARRSIEPETDPVPA